MSNQEKFLSIPVDGTQDHNTGHSATGSRDTSKAANSDTLQVLDCGQLPFSSYARMTHATSSRKSYPQPIQTSSNDQQQVSSLSGSTETKVQSKPQTQVLLDSFGVRQRFSHNKPYLERSGHPDIMPFPLPEETAASKFKNPPVVDSEDPNHSLTDLQTDPVLEIGQSEPPLDMIPYYMTRSSYPQRSATSKHPTSQEIKGQRPQLSSEESYEPWRRLQSNTLPSNHLNSIQTGPPTPQQCSEPTQRCCITMDNDYEGYNLPKKAVDDNAEERFDELIKHDKHQYFSYSNNPSLIDPSIAENGEVHLHIIKELSDSKHKLNNELNMAKQQCETLRQALEDYKLFTKDQLNAQPQDQCMSVERYPMDKQPHGLIKEQLNAQPQDQCTSAEKYPMDKQPHGIAVIIINNFSIGTLKYRKGSDVDKDNQTELWKYLGYEVKLLENLTASDLKAELTKVSKQNHEDYDSFVCVISSHGKDDSMYGANGELLAIKEIAELFTSNRCSTLAGKPKLFFIQACIAVQSTMPEVDFFFGYAALPDKKAHREHTIGSFFLSILRDVVKRKAKQMDLMHMMNIVKRIMSKNSVEDGQRLCCTVNETLRRDVWFFQPTSLHVPLCLYILLLVFICVLLNIIYYLDL